jgi:hypothetical protein
MVDDMAVAVGSRAWMPVSSRVATANLIAEEVVLLGKERS